MVKAGSPVSRRVLKHIKYEGSGHFVPAHSDLITAPCNPFNHRTGVYGAMVGSGIVKIRSGAML